MTGLPSDAGPESGLRLSDAEIRLPHDVDPAQTYDVLLNGQHVWSLQPTRDADGDAAPWPKALLTHLVGRAEVSLRDHVTGRVVAHGHHVFAGDDQREVTVTDRAGQPLVLDKYGRLIRPLSSEDEAGVDALLDQVEQLLRFLRDKTGVEAFVAYGTLLGAVRNGRLIGHDNDIDIAYVSDHAYPVDVMREGYRIERALLRAGWVVRRGSGARLNVRLHQDDGLVRFVDIFTAHWVDGVLFMPADTGFRLPRETILPLTTVGLHGRRLPAPADYERLLAETYGPGWRTPDPSFRYDTPKWLGRRINGWFGGLGHRRKGWDAFYGGPGRRLPKRPTAFAQWVAERYPSSRHLVDVGAGNGRDARWFATTHGRRVTALDYSLGVLNRTARRAADDPAQVQFVALNLYDSREVLALGTRLTREAEPVDLYARFLLHDLEASGRDHLLRLASMTLRREGYLFLEFRTPEDRQRPHHFPPRKHPRLYQDPAEVTAMIEARGGRVLEVVSGTGLASFRDEDPHVCRIVATWAPS